MAKSAETHEEKPKTAVEKAASKTVEATKNQLESTPGGDTHGAYNKLIESVNTTRAELKKADPSGKQGKAYEEAVVKDLAAGKLLPTLALEFGKRAFTKIDQTVAASGSGDGQITAAELKTFQATGRPGVLGSAMSEALIQQPVSKYNIRDTRSGFNTGDLQAAIMNGQKARENGVTSEAQANLTASQQFEASRLKDYLLAGKDGKPSVFKLADYAGAPDPVSKTDGQLMKHDFEALAADPRTTAAQRKEIEEKVIAKWDDSDFQKRYLNLNGAMTEESLKKASGELQPAKTESASEPVESGTTVATEQNKQAQELRDLLAVKVGNDATVFSAADFAGSSDSTSRQDKLVSKQDLEALVKSPDIDPELAKQIQAKLIDKMDDRTFKSNYMSGNDINLDKIAAAAESEDQTSARAKEAYTADAEVMTESRQKAIHIAEALLADDALRFRSVDYAGSSNLSARTDKLIDVHDFRAFAGNPMIAPDAKKFIEEEIINKWDTAEVRQLRNGRYMSLKSLKNAIPNSLADNSHSK
jgi:hypothetical protein